MKITTIGKGNIGGGLGARWRNAVHGVTELGQDGGDASDADAVLLAVPSLPLSHRSSRLRAVFEPPRRVVRGRLPRRL